jgi:hypothetical protein
MIEFRHIEPERTSEQWFKIRHDVKRALDNSANTCWPEDVRAMLADGAWSLVLLEDSGKYRGCMVLSVAQYLRKRALQVVVLGGRRIEEVRSEVQDWLESSANRLNCSMIEATGRIGWLRALKRHGWNTEMVSMTFEVKHNGRNNHVSTG